MLPTRHSGISRDRIAKLAMIPFVIAGCVWVVFEYYTKAWNSDAVASLLLATLIPAYLAVSLISRPSNRRPLRR